MMGFDVFDTLVRACGIGVLCSLCIMLFGRSGGYSGALRIGGAVLLFGMLVALLGGIADKLWELANISGDSYVGDAFSVMLRGLGVALIGKFCGDICRDCGEEGLASGVESVGRAVILLLALPMLLEAMQLSAELLGGL